RCVQAVEVETIEAGPRVFVERSVVIVQPVDESLNLTVAPHPGRESCETFPVCRGSMNVADMIIDSKCVRPICFCGHDIEAFLADERLAYSGAHPVELGCAM